jgi:hypothetical protein
MELPGTSYLYTMAMLGMTFIGFSAIVMQLRQTLGRAEKVIAASVAKNVLLAFESDAREGDELQVTQAVMARSFGVR